MSQQQGIADGSYDPKPRIRTAQPKATGPGKEFLFGQTLVYDVVNNVWDKTVSGSAGRFGFCSNPQEFTKVTNEFTGEVETMRGVDEDINTCSVLVEGRVQKQAEGPITAGSYVKVAATDPNKLAEWISGTDPVEQIVGIYVENLSQEHDANEPVPDAVDGDWIKISNKEKTTVI